MVKSLILRLALNAATLWLLMYVMPSITYTGGVKFFIIAGFFLTILNLCLKPLLKILAFPFVIVTAGLFMIIINALLLWILASFLNSGAFEGVSLVIPGRGSYLIAGFLLGLLNWVLNSIFRK